MADVDIDTDLAQINQQLEQLVGQLTQVNTQRDQLTQQIHNLNGIAMYLRGKQPPSADATVEVSENSTSGKATTAKES
jgi:peptidoglycan hydrolase CwlO-like protein